MRKEYNSIDLGRFVFCILIVSLHADALLDLSPTLNLYLCQGIARLGVPFFFTVSAFFFFAKPVSWVNTKQYCRRLLTLYFAWFIVYIPKTIFEDIICSKYSFGETMFRFIREFFVTSSFSGSWFLCSCIWCAVYYTCINENMRGGRNAKYYSIAICVIVYSWIVFTSAYGRLLDTIGLAPFYRWYELFLGKPCNSFLVGIPYFALGKFWANNIEKMLTNQNKYNIGMIITLLLLLIEVYITSSNALVKATDCYLMLLPCMYFIFPSICNMNIKLRSAKLLRKISTVVFFSQFYFLFGCEFLEWLCKNEISHAEKFLIAVVGGTIIAIFLESLSKKQKLEWLKAYY